MGLSWIEKLDGHRTAPLPEPYMVAILRRVARGHLTLTLGKDEKGNPRTYFTYDDGAIVYGKKGKTLSTQAVDRGVKAGWLIPIEGESLLEDGPPQRYRARTPEDGPLPKYKAGR